MDPRFRPSDNDIEYQFFQLTPSFMASNTSIGSPVAATIQPAIPQSSSFGLVPLSLRTRTDSLDTVGSSNSSSSSSNNTHGPAPPTQNIKDCKLAPGPERYVETPTGGAGGGPISKQYIPPNRPKPGRKASTNQPDTKRKQQNREAQRNFRQRRTEKVSELEQKNAVLKSEKNAVSIENSRLKLDNEALLLQVRSLQQNCDALSKEKEQLSSQLEASLHASTHAFGTSSNLHTPIGGGMNLSTPPMGVNGETVQATLPDVCISCRGSGSCACLNIVENATTVQLDQTRGETTGAYPIPSHSGNLPIEQDFTNYLGTQSATGVGFSLPETRSEVSEKDIADEDDDDLFDGDHIAPPSQAIAAPADPDPCGFCTNPSNCLCRPEETTKQRANRPIKVAEKISSTSMPPPSIRPGTCEQCMADPEQRRFCEGLARTRPPQSSPADGDGPSSKRRRLSLAQPRKDVVSCNEAYAIYTARLNPNTSDSPEKDLESFYQDCVRTTVPPAISFSSKREEISQRYSAYDVELAGCLLQLRDSNNSDNGGA